MLDSLGTAEFWVAVSFAAFIGLLLYFRIDKFITESLDQRAAAIAKELEEAANLREEAQALLVSYQRKQREAKKEAEEIIAQAHREAERMGREAEEALERQIERRTEMAEDKIAQAEAKAAKEVQKAAAAIATNTARHVIKARMDDNLSNELLDKSIQELKTDLH